MRTRSHRSNPGGCHSVRRRVEAQGPAEKNPCVIFFSLRVFRFYALRLSNDAFAKPFSPFDASFLSNIRLCRCIICIYIEFFFFETIKQLRLIYLSLLKRDFSFFLSKNGVQASFRKNSADFLRNSRSLGTRVL